ncbi:MAG: site-specific integrase [Bacteroidales bacterium]|nr:site-specific integrase [Bacteroidales bacterium]MCM1417109.1 site-specific integrase [bacterium]
MSRRGDNIRKRTDGRWEGRYQTLSENGEKYYRSVYGKSYHEVKEKLDAERRTVVCKEPVCRIVSGESANLAGKFCTLAEEWLKNIEASRKYSTYVKYETIYRCHIQKNFSDMQIADITGKYIRDQLSALDVSDATRQNVLMIIKQIFHYAEKEYAFSSPAISGSSGYKRAQTLKIMSRAEQARLIQFLCKDMDISKAGIYLCLSTGLRLGEVCALKWGDIEKSGSLLHVNRTVQRIRKMEGSVKTALLETTPKSFSSKRDIPIPDALLSILIDFRKEGQEYVLQKDRPMEPRTYQNHFKRYLEEINVPNYNFHILRHTFATNCIDNGMDIKSLSEILGHSNVQITLNRYVHPSMETKRKYLNALSADYGQLCGQISEQTLFSRGQT